MMAVLPKVLCPTLDMMLRKTILALCEVNVKYDYKLEICGSLHIRSDDQKVLTCLIDEQIFGHSKKSDGLLMGAGADADGIKKGGFPINPMKIIDTEAVDLSNFEMPQQLR